MSSLTDRLLANSKVKGTAKIRDSKVFGKKDMIQTNVPMVNVALSGKLDGGLVPGMLMLAGPSKHFKSAFALLMAASFQKKHPDGVVLFYDSEFGSPEAYFESFGIDMDHVVHTPIMNVEELKFDIMSQLDALEKDDKVFILIDSIGNLASKKEVEDALDEKSVADMTRAKQLKSLFRMVTPHLNMKDIPLVAVNHTYKTLEMYAKDVVSGGTGGYYSADAIWIIGRRQDKNDKTKTIEGYDFIINIEKSRHVREGSKVPISVSFEGGIQKWSGLFDVALNLGWLEKSGIWYKSVDPRTGEVLEEKSYKKKEIIDSKEFWLRMFDREEFRNDVTHYYTLSGSVAGDDEDVLETIDQDMSEDEEQE